MTNRERVRSTLGHTQPDRIPYCISFTKVAKEKMARFYNDADFESKLGNCFVLLSSEPRGSWRQVRPNIWEDQFGVQWDRSIDQDIGVVCNRLVTEKNYKGFPFPDPDDSSRFSEYLSIIQANPDGFFVVDLGWTLYERAWTLAGMENVLAAMADNGSYVHGLFERITEWNLRMIENICRYPIDAIWFGDDWGHQHGLLMGPQLWREFLKPYMKLLFQKVKSKGKYVFIHSCGKVEELFQDLIKCGLDLFNPFQPEVMHVFEAKRRHGGQLSFWGGISTQRSLPYKRPSEVKQEVKALIEQVGKGGGYIAAPAHDIPADAKPENIAAMIEVLQNQ